MDAAAIFVLEYRAEKHNERQTERKLPLDFLPPSPDLFAIVVVIRSYLEFLLSPSVVDVNVNEYSLRRCISLGVASNFTVTATYSGISYNFTRAIGPFFYLSLRENSR